VQLHELAVWLASQGRADGIVTASDRVMRGGLPNGRVSLATENIYKLYAESFRGKVHLRRNLEEAQAMANGTLAVAPDLREKS
jgi:phosphoglucomutase